MGEVRKSASLISRLLRAFGVSARASLLSAFAGILAFGAFASLLTWFFEVDELPFDGPDFALVGLNVLPVAVIAGLVSFGAQMRPAATLKQCMLVLLALMLAAVMACAGAAIYSNDGIGVGLIDLLCLLGAVIPCGLAVIAHWALVNWALRRTGSIFLIIPGGT
ncbi:hypothetical protein PYH37_003695 [Sinorhizobium numidicum]|uniref:Transmembrane protein n=1 Tax=Sinorhizobium numidicum TaxID=680248 RepID=A0ABY8CZH6_9HYPH|nr:hypothetical protein [Sinorhizobium numidicum]WEX78771.1 hypothetical protein PYH37_003695 [Sinorhizobium numidicum]WEX82168.1 hypothetical protein PYH38_004408 [Sinorhizobium numidicum]